MRNWLLFFAYPDYEVISTGSKSSRIVLPDGTNVNLNAATTIKYSKKYFARDRKLELVKGEAFVQVLNHNGPQFHITIGDVEAIDIGTSFNLLKTDQTIKITVEEGQVAMKHPPTAKQITLGHGEIGIYDQATKVLRSDNNQDVNYKAWLDKKFVFQEVPLVDVLSQLEDVYQIPISIDGETLKNKKFTATLHYETLDSALAVISASLQCKTIKLKDSYLLSEK